VGKSTRLGTDQGPALVLKVSQDALCNARSQQDRQRAKAEDASPPPKHFVPTGMAKMSPTCHQHVTKMSSSGGPDLAVMTPAVSQKGFLG